MIYTDFNFQEILDYRNNPLMLKFISKYQLPQITSFPVDFTNKQVTALIMISEAPLISRREPDVIANEFLEKYLKDEIVLKYHNKNYKIKIQNLWEHRKRLANILKIPLYIVFWNDEIVISFEYYPSQNIQVMSWKEYVEKFTQLKSLRRQTKPLMYTQKSLFNQLLEKYNVTWGGDLDGFYFDENEHKIIILEFSTRNVSCENILKHDINNYLNEDYRRWEALFILKENLKRLKFKSHISVIVWSPCCKEFLLVNRDLDKKDGKIIFNEQLKLTAKLKR